MKAIRYETFGPPETLTLKEVDVPTPQSHQVLVKVRAASINALEWRRFTMPSFLVPVQTGGWLRPKDSLLGADVAGQVEAAGKDVTRFKPGDDVFGFAHGSFAEYALSRETSLALKPANCTFEEAAAVPVAGLTALQAIRRAGGIQRGQQVLIHGASGGIGMYAVQLAKTNGAEVTAVCRTRNFALARSWGADHVVDYTQEDFTQSGQRYDLILGVNGYRSLWAYRRVLKPQGVYLCAGGAVPQILQAILFGKWLSQKGGQTLKSMGISKINPNDTEALGELLREGKLTPVIDRCYPLHETASAFHHILEHHAQGKVIIQVAKG